MNIGGIFNEETHTVYDVRKSGTIRDKGEYKSSSLGNKCNVI